jgi:hypothetical protein
MALKIAIEESFDILGPSAKRILLKILKEHGIDLDDIDKSYSLDTIKQMIMKVSDEDTADLILIRIKQVLKKYGANTGTSQILKEQDVVGEISSYSKNQDKGITALTLTSKQVNYLYSAVSNMIADIEDLNLAREKFGSRGEYYIREMQTNLPALQEMLREVLKKGRRRE